jgi:hypothetical protein
MTRSLVLSAAAFAVTIFAAVAPAQTTVQTTPQANGSIGFTASVYSTDQSTGVAEILIQPQAGTSGGVSVSYATVDGTAVAGVDYTAKSGTLSWSNGQISPQSFNVLLSFTPFYGTRTFTVVLSNPTNGAALATPSTATITINGSGGPPCGGKGPGSYVTSNAFDWVQDGNFTVQQNNWGGDAGQALWVDSAECWGVSNTRTTEIYGISADPGVQRGWTQNCTAFNALGGAAWTAQSGMGIQVSALTKARVHWAFTAPAPYPVSRWNALIDTYFWTQMPTTCSGDSHEWNSKIVDLMVDQSINDQVLNGQSYYAQVAAQNNATLVIIYPLNPSDPPSAYLVYVDNPNQVFNAPGGHTIEMFLLPSAWFTPGLAVWGSNDSVTDLAAIVKFWSQPNPLDVYGNPILYGNGTPITAPVISPSYYLGETYAGFEQDFGSPFVTTAFCMAVQNEPDCQ